MPLRNSSIAGFVLAGGASLRMGRDKALLVIGGETMLARQVRLLRLVCRSAAALGPPERLQPLGVPIIADEISGRGPLAGIYAALLHSRTEYNLLLSCDMPFMEPRFLRSLCRLAMESAADVTLPEAQDLGSRLLRLHPLCAVYRKKALPAVRASLVLDENRVSRFIRHVPCRVWHWREIHRAGFRPNIFANMNTFADYEAAIRMIVDGRA